jgi:anthranilate phosphoribosyltransferase
VSLPIATILDTLSRRSLTREEATGVFSQIVEGNTGTIELAGLLSALKARGETADEIAGAAQALRRAARPFPRPTYRFADTCGTGGDALGTRNVSTAAAVVAAELGIPIVKHGNRAVCSSCGSADVLEALGVRLDATPAIARRCLDETGVCFLFAPHYHAGVSQAGPVRRALGTRTIFNLVGPLANPSRPPVQIVGVYEPRLCRPIAATLEMLGCEAALVVHGDGLDELALHGGSCAVLLQHGVLTEMELTPEAAGLRRAPLEELKGGTPRENAQAMRLVLSGRDTGAYRDAVALNAGALAWVFGRARSLTDGVAVALEAMASGLAGERLDRWIEVSHGA